MIKYCFATGAVSGQYYLGGLVGFHTAINLSTPVVYCYARGNVTGAVQVGGLVGVLKGLTDYGLVTDSFATGAVRPLSNPADNGGLVGYDWYSGGVSSCYYDLETTGYGTTGKGTPLMTADMKTAGSFYYWDFTNIWSIDATGAINDGYPYLKNNPPATTQSSLAASINSIAGKRRAIVIALGAAVLSLGVLGELALYRRRSRTA